MTDARSQALAKMAANGQPDEAIAVFAAYHEALSDNHFGQVPEAEINPVSALPQVADLEFSAEEQQQAIAATAMVKLNGGLGTSMGMRGPKSAVTVRDGKSFLDIIAQQVLAARATYQAALPVVFMNSFSTQVETEKILSQYPDLPHAGLPLSFLQNASPKLAAATLEPVQWPANPALEWCPPGHGDVYVALLASGVLATLVEQGFNYLFISNSDNLGATPDPKVAAWMAAHQVNFGMEVLTRTRMDRKGGHLAQRKSDGRLILRELAMVPESDLTHFTDVTKHQFFNSNSLWLNIAALHDVLTARSGDLGLPMIVNKKTVDPTDKNSTQVIQLESAMGSAIEVFDQAHAIVVPRTRFRPVKTTNDLLLLRSDFYHLDDAGQLVAQTSAEAPFIDLDTEHYKIMADFDARFAGAIPSLVNCTSFKVTGDIWFTEPLPTQGQVDLEWTGPGQGTATAHAGEITVQPR